MPDHFLVRHSDFPESCHHYETGRNPVETPASFVFEVSFNVFFKMGSLRETWAEIIITSTLLSETRVEI